MRLRVSMESKFEPSLIIITNNPPIVGWCFGRYNLEIKRELNNMEHLTSTLTYKLIIFSCMY